MPKELTSLERVLKTINFEEPDRVPFFLLLTMHGARELGLSIKEYFSRAENVAEGQLRLREKYRHDCYYTFFYAPIEIEAWGGAVIYREDGPPNAGAPFIKELRDIRQLELPKIKNNPALSKVLKATSLLKEKVKDEVPIIGVVMSPFSLPVMQLGFDRYIELIYENEELFYQLMNINQEFCVSWANAQIEVGATAICYFDPLSSSTIIPKELFLNTGFNIAKRTIARINGPVAIHMASGRAMPILQELSQTGGALLGVSCLEDLGELKTNTKGKLPLFGNLNGLEMIRWTIEETEQKVKEAIAKGGLGGGFILSDNHGEIPWQVSEEVLLAISKAVNKWGRYHLKWVKKDE